MSLKSRMAAQAEEDKEDSMEGGEDTTKGGDAEGENKEDSMEGGEDTTKGGDAEGEDKEDSMEGGEDTTKGGDAEGEEKDESAKAAAIARACTEAGEPTLAAPLIRSRAAMPEVKRKIANAAKIREAVAAANRQERAVDLGLADSFVAAGCSLEHVKAELFDVMQSAAGPAIRNNVSSGAAAQSGGDQAVASSWDRSFKKTAPRNIA